MRRLACVLAATLCLSVVINVRSQTAQSLNVSQAAVTPGELFVEPPTLINLGFEWFIEGDEQQHRVFGDGCGGRIEYSLA